MKMKKLVGTAAAACLLFASLTACTAEKPLLPNKVESDNDLCTFTLNTGSRVSVDTRAIDETAINEVWVVQLSNDGTAALTAPQQLTPNADNKIKAKLELVESKIYFFANTGNNALFDTTADLSSYSTSVMEKVKVAYTTNSGDWGKRTNTPLYGTWTGTPKAPVIAESPNDQVELIRTLAHIEVSLTTTGTMATDFYVESIQLVNVPTVTFMVTTPNADAIYPASATTTFGNYPANTFSPSKALGSSTLSYDFYMPENCRGKGSERYETEKNGTLLSGGNHATYLEVKGTLGASDAVKLKYRFFLGGNNTNDYNVRRGYSYTVKIEISGMNPTDTRMTIEGTSTINGGATIEKDWGSTNNAGSGDLGTNS